MSNLTQAEKDVFLAATNRRKARGIRLKRFCILAEESQVVALTELYSSWVERFGKTVALDHVIMLWARAEARLRDADEQKERKNANGSLSPS